MSDPRAERTQGRRRGDALSFLRSGEARPRFNARAHGRFVTAMKLGLGGCAVALMAVVLSWPEIHGTDAPVRLKKTTTEVSEPKATFSVSKARYFGVDPEGRKFDITAKEAHNVGADTKRIRLSDPKASVVMTDKARLDLEAAEGRLDGTGKILKLDGGVTLSHSEGYRVTTQDAAVDLDKGTAQGDRAVVGTGSFGRLEGEGFRIDDRGRVITLGGSSRLLIKSSRGGE